MSRTEDDAMRDNINRQWRLANRPQGMVQDTDFAYHETAVPEPHDGPLLVRNLSLACDPARQGRRRDRPSDLAPLHIGDVMEASGAGHVVASRHPSFPLGAFVRGRFGWQDAMATSSAGRVSPTKMAPGGALTLP
jgi:NADPH-dependent curcumin reductase CurA